MRIVFGIGLFLCLTLSSCLSTKQVKDGKTAFDLKQYAIAIPYLEDDIASLSQDDPAYAEYCFLLASSYKYTNDSKNSLKWFIEASKNDYGPEAYYEMAYMLKKNERYQDALLSFRRLLQLLPDRTNELNKEIEKCILAQVKLPLLKDDSYVITPLEICTNFAEYAPFLYDDETLYFTSDRVAVDQEDSYAWTGHGYADLYSYDLIDGMVTKLEPPLNSDDNEGVISFNQTRDIAYFTKCFSGTGDHHCRIMESKYQGNQWSKPREVFVQKPNVNYGDPVLIENDSVLLFTSNDPTGFGAHDLYYSIIAQDGTWSTPELMPPYLNTLGNERFPTWQNDTLFYSSDFLPGFGGLDIFKTTLNKDNTWAQPVNIGQPFNSPEDDYTFIIAPVSSLEYDVKSKVYFTSTREVAGSDDIYVGVQYKTKEDFDIERTPVDTIDEDIILDYPKSLFLQVTIKEKLFAAPDNPNSYVVGTKVVPEASIKFTTDTRDDIFISDDLGQILLPIDTGVVYHFLVGKKGYLNNAQDYTIQQNYIDIADGEVLELDIEIERIFEGVEIVLENIYYDFNESSIREDAKPSLNYLVKILNDNPALQIQLSSHTDCRGEEHYNIDLSQRRARAAVQYIASQTSVAMGGQLSSIGYGAAIPEIECPVCDDCSEDEHQINRRTTFKILK